MPDRSPIEMAPASPLIAESHADPSGDGSSTVDVNPSRHGFFSSLSRTEMWTYFGPAFVASVAYIDPGNFATNILGGTQFGYRLLWVLLWSNVMAMLIQYLAAKLGIVTGLTLPQNCRKYFTRPSTLGLWIAAEIAAVATDLAEFLGAAIGLDLLFGPLLAAHGFNPKETLLAAALVSTVLVFAILALDLAGFRWLERAIMGFVAMPSRSSLSTPIGSSRPSIPCFPRWTTPPRRTSTTVSMPRSPCWAQP
jgi:manganese transport protein